MKDLNNILLSNPQPYLIINNSISGQSLSILYTYLIWFVYINNLVKSITKYK